MILSGCHDQKLLLILRAVHSYGEPLPLIEAMHVDFLHIDPLEIYRIAQERRNPYDFIAKTGGKAYERVASNR